MLKISLDTAKHSQFLLNTILRSSNYLSEKGNLRIHIIFLLSFLQLLCHIPFLHLGVCL